MILKSYQHGHCFEDESFLVFFGNRFLSKTSLLDLYPYPFTELNQTHGDTLVEQHLNAPISSTQADAHYTYSNKFGLLIKTADCVPIFVFDSSLNTSLAIHAGWRGIENQIVIKSIHQLFQKSTSLTLLIGPFIHQESFEVDADVKERLLNTLPENFRELCFIENKNNHQKFLIDLKMILLFHLKIAFPKKEFNFLDLQINTYTNLKYNSFRRDKTKTERNYSFIMRK